MRILAIESSCDETAAAIVEDGRRVLANVVASQTRLHRAYHGVVPELASRSHIEYVLPVVAEALRLAGIDPGAMGARGRGGSDPKDRNDEEDGNDRRDRRGVGIDAVAVTRGPGLVGALLVGVETAKTLAWRWRVPLIAVHHTLGHLMSVFCELPDGRSRFLEVPPEDEAGASPEWTTPENDPGAPAEWTTPDTSEPTSGVDLQVRATEPASGADLRVRATEPQPLAPNVKGEGAQQPGPANPRETTRAADGTTNRAAEPPTPSTLHSSPFTLHSSPLTPSPSSFRLSPFAFPFLGLAISGGHCSLVRVDGPTRVCVLGSTLDDAPGEAYDKVAKCLGLGYPGGPEVDRRAALGNPKAFDLPRPILHRGYDFSFSGLKTSVVRAIADAGGLTRFRADEALLNDLCASFQAAVIDVLLAKADRALRGEGLRRLAVVGGVACNRGLRAAAPQRLRYAHLVFPVPALCTDNAAMIGAAAFHLPALAPDEALRLDARAGWDLGESLG